MDMALQPDSAVLPHLATVEQMAAILCVSTQTLYRHMAEGTAPPSFRTGRKILFPLGPVFDEWTRERVAEPHVV
jgi:predicted DNA-binding transcriptional regulator AlpA